MKSKFKLCISNTSYRLFIVSKLSSENLAREELDRRKIERDAAKEAKEKEDREEKKRERDRQDTRDQMSQLVQIHMMKSIIPGQGLGDVLNVPLPQAAAAAAIPVRQKLEINLKMKEETDSDSYPVKIFIESFDDLVQALRDFCEIDKEKSVKIILHRNNRILDLGLIENGSSYDVEFKMKEGFARVYLD